MRRNISFAKNKELSTTTADTRELKTRYGTIHRVDYFKYLGEITKPKILEKTSAKYKTTKSKRSTIAYYYTSDSTKHLQKEIDINDQSTEKSDTTKP